MKFVITSLFFLLTAFAAYAQDDDTVQYIHGLPQTGEDTVQQEIPQDDVAPTDSIVQLSPEQLPRELAKALGENPLYKGWEKSTIQLDRNTGLYWLHIRDQRTTRSYGFDDEGHPVTIREKTDPE